MTFKDDARDTARISAGVIALGAVTLIVVVTLAAMWIFGFGWFQRGTANFRGETAAIEQTRASGRFRVQAYDRFFDLCSAIQEDEGRVAALEQELAGSPTPERRTQVEASLTAVRSARNGKIRTYNNDAAKDFTVGQFRDNDLPYRLDPNAKETVCVTDS